MGLAGRRDRGLRPPPPPQARAFAPRTPGRQYPASSVVLAGASPRFALARSSTGSRFRQSAGWFVTPCGTTTCAPSSTASCALNACTNLCVSIMMRLRVREVALRPSARPGDAGASLHGNCLGSPLTDGFACAPPCGPSASARAPALSRLRAQSLRHGRTPMARRRPLHALRLRPQLCARAPAAPRPPIAPSRLSEPRCSGMTATHKRAAAERAGAANAGVRPGGPGRHPVRATVSRR